MADFSLTDPQDSSDDPRHSARQPQSSRVAKFVSPVNPEADGQTQPLMTRQVRYRAGGEASARQEALAGFVANLQEELALIPHHQQASAARLRALAQVAEAKGDDEAAILRYQQLRRQQTLTGQDWQALRRHYKAIGDVALVELSLEHGQQASQGAALALVQLEQARTRWLGEDPAEQIALYCEQVKPALDEFDEETLAFAEFWRAQLLLDAQLSGADIDGAIEVVDELLVQTPLPEHVRRPLRLMQALWLASTGHSERAVESLLPMLEADDSHAQLAADVVTFLLFANGESARAERLLLRQAATRALDKRWSSTMTYLLAHIARRMDATLAMKLLRQHAQSACPELGLLRLHAQLLEERIAKGDEIVAAGQELIDVLNATLELLARGPSRAEVLLRLGQLYEQFVLDEQAAAEVYHEALQIQPEHFAILRALGRIYSRQERWQSLAELYEHEIRVLELSQHGEVWRRHYQVAQVYEERLCDVERALEHYAKVLATKPCDLPSLKASARLLEGTGQWTRLADLFLVSVEHTRSARQRLYMLDKVAEIAEHHLQRPEIAIGAWEEILRLHPEHPTAYASLGRLYTRQGCWDELLWLNSMERELLDDPLEIAGMHLRDAEIAQERLNNVELAEGFYRQALLLVPDYLPALEGLGRLLVQAERWDELVRMGTKEFGAMSEVREQVRQLTALAQLCDEQLGRAAEAIKLYSSALKRAPGDVHIQGCLLRLLEREGRWADVEGLLRWRIEREERPVQAATAHGELAQLLEWRLERRAESFEHYEAALLFAPDEPTWIDGVARCWAEAGRKIEQVIATLERAASSARKPEAITRYATVLARCHELAAQVPEAGAAWRERGNPFDLEHGMMRRLTLGLFGDRQGLNALRLSSPWHPWELLTVAGRERECWPEDPMTLKSALEQAPAPVRQWMLHEVDSSGLLILDVKGSPRELTADLMRFESGAPLADEQDLTHLSGMAHRLRALYALAQDDQARYARHTELELVSLKEADLKVHRLLEFAKHVPSHTVQFKTLLVEAATAAFPELEDVALTLEGFDGPIMDALYDALFDAQMWALKRRCLELHVARKNLGVSRRAYLFDMLSDMLERYLEDYEAALEARISCWQLGKEPDHLVAIVRLCEQLEYAEQAVGYQHELYESLQHSATSTITRRVEEGLKLVELILKGQSVEDGLMMLELLLEDYEGSHEELQIRLRLARAHAELANPHTAARQWREALGKLPVAGYLDDWRAYVALYEGPLRDPSTAYQLQWTLVRHEPTDEQALGRLVELAERAGALDQCARELVRFAQGFLAKRPDAGRALLECAVALLDGRLNLYDEAAKAYAELSLLANADRDSRARHEWTRRRARCLSRILGRQREALSLFSELTQADPFDHEAFAGMATLLDHVQTYDRARVVKQVLRTLGQDVPANQERVKTVPSRQLDDIDELELLMPAHMPLELFDVFSAAAPLMERVLPDAGPQRKDLDSDRRAQRDLAPVADLFAIMFDAVGIRRVNIMFGEALKTPFEVVWDKEVLVWLNLGMIERLDDAELRYLAALCAALAWTDMPSLRHMDGRQLWHLLDAVQVVQDGVGLSGSASVSAVSAELAKQIAPTRYAVTRRRVFQLANDVLETLQANDGSSWSSDIEDFAHKLALAICGDVEAATRAILKFEGWRYDLSHDNTQARVRQHPRIRQLIRFALTEDYLKVRYAMGLSGRPSTIDL